MTVMLTGRVNETTENNLKFDKIKVSLNSATQSMKYSYLLYTVQRYVNTNVSCIDRMLFCDSTLCPFSPPLAS